jgi:hypothetical protein
MAESTTRFSLLTAFIVLTGGVIGCAALANHTPWWGYSVVTATFALLSAAVLLAIAQRSGRRVFWACLAVIGWGYLLITLHPVATNVGRSLVTTQLLVVGWQSLDTTKIEGGEARRERDKSVERYALTTLMWQGSPDEYTKSLQAFFFAGQSLWALALGATGGVLGCFVYDRRVLDDGVKETSHADYASSRLIRKVRDQMESMSRYCLLTLLIVTTSLLLGILAMAFPTPGWKYVVVSLAVALLGCATVIAVGSRRGSRVYWAGLAIVGWGYVFLAMHPYYAGAGRSLVTTRLLVLAWNAADVPKPATTPGMPTSMNGAAENYAVWALSSGWITGVEQRAYLRRVEAFFFAGQSAWAIMLGSLSGLLGLFVYRRARREAEPESTIY